MNGFIRTTEAVIRELEHLVVGRDPRQLNALSIKVHHASLLTCKYLI